MKHTTVTLSTGDLVFYSEEPTILFGDIQVTCRKSIYRYPGGYGPIHALDVVVTKRPHAYAKRRTSPAYVRDWIITRAMSRTS